MAAPAPPHRPGYGGGRAPHGSHAAHGTSPCVPVRAAPPCAPPARHHDANLQIDQAEHAEGGAAPEDGDATPPAAAEAADPVQAAAPHHCAPPPASEMSAALRAHAALPKGAVQRLMEQVWVLDPRDAGAAALLAATGPHAGPDGEMLNVALAELRRLAAADGAAAEGAHGPEEDAEEGMAEAAEGGAEPATAPPAAVPPADS
eukprot:gene12374-63268_t